MRTMLVKKQSQFPAGKIPHYSTIPSFQYSIRDPVVQDKANRGYAGRKPWADSVRKTH
jgi:hypothetical protein